MCARRCRTSDTVTTWLVHAKSEDETKRLKGVANQTVTGQAADETPASVP